MQDNHKSLISEDMPHVTAIHHTLRPHVVSTRHSTHGSVSVVTTWIINVQGYNMQRVTCHALHVTRHMSRSWYFVTVPKFRSNINVIIRQKEGRDQKQRSNRFLHTVNCTLMSCSHSFQINFTKYQQHKQTQRVTATNQNFNQQ